MRECLRCGRRRSYPAAVLLEPSFNDPIILAPPSVPDFRYKGRNIHEVLDITVEDALAFYQAVPAVARKLQTLADAGLSYIKLGQNATTLSGGEAQRVKLARELSKRDTGQTLYILDEPTTGLHFHDIEQLLKVLHELRGDAGMRENRRLMKRRRAANPAGGFLDPQNKPGGIATHRVS